MTPEDKKLHFKAKLFASAITAAVALFVVVLPNLPAAPVVRQEQLSATGKAEKTLKERVLELPDAKTRATFKGREIAKALRGENFLRRVDIGDYDVQVVDVEEMDGGVTVFARAWDGASGKQIGFGDGSIDIERFRVFNPPILVPDGTKRPMVSDTGEAYELDNFKEDPEKAIHEALEETIRVVPRGTPEKIVAGKQGRTTSTFYPDANAESTSVDGRAGNSTSSQSWGTKVAGSGTDHDDSTDIESVFYVQSGAVLDEWAVLRRAFYLFDTSAIPDTDTVTSATLSVKGTFKGDNLSVTPDLNVYASTPASNTAIADGDYSNVGTTAFSTAVSYANYLVDGSFTDWALNASGIAAVTVSGVSKFSLRNASYDVANVSPTWSSAQTTQMNGYYADNTGTTSDPKLVVVHAAPVTFVPKIIIH